MNKTKYIVGWIFVIVSVLLALGLLVRITKVQPQMIISPVVETLESLEIPFIRQIRHADSLENSVKKIIGNEKGTYGIQIKHLGTDETYMSGEHRVFQSGSLYKLWVMAAAYEQIKKGTLRETDILEQEISVLNEKFNIATEDAQLTEGKITLSVTDALNQMITISDNYAALLLSEKVRLSNVAKFLKANGFSESKVGTDGSIPVTTPSDIALFYEKLYKGNLIDAEYDEKMLELLKHQKLNNKIPKNIPENITIAHKTGELNFFTHDGGIVYAPKGDYIIVVFSETPKPLNAEQKIAELSEAVYGYFVNK